MDNIPINLSIDKISPGYNYILILTKYKECYYITKDSIKICNDYIKSKIRDISSGPDFFFLVKDNNHNDLNNILYDHIENHINMISDDNEDNIKYFDCYISIKENNLLKYPCHSFIIKQFIDINKFNNNILELSLSRKELQYLIKLIYTGTIEFISEIDELKYIIYKTSGLYH